MELNHDDCISCCCCSFCLDKCGCKAGLETSKGFFRVLGIDTPREFSEIENYIKMNIKEEEEDSGDSIDELDFSEPLTTSDSDLEDMATLQI